jgi:oligopeptidase A
LLSYLELRKLFHEFGHCLHQVFSQASNWRLSHDEGMGRDEVEFRGKVLEQWALSSECLLAVSAHYQTGKQAPAQIINDWLASQKAQSGLKLAKELRAALIDLELHLGANAAKGDVQAVADRVTNEVLVLPLPEDDRFANGFDYMVTGYEAGYFVYQWAELYAADTFGRFKEEGVFNPVTGQALREHIFAPGAWQSLSTAFQAFRGRPVSAQAFLGQTGLL